MFNLSCWSSILGLGFHHLEVVLAKEKLKLEKSPEFQIFAWSARAEGFPLERENRPPSSFGKLCSPLERTKWRSSGGLISGNFEKLNYMIFTCQEAKTVQPVLETHFCESSMASIDSPKWTSLRDLALWTISVLFSLPQAPVMYVLYRKACGNLGLLAGYDANLLGAGLGRDITIH
ncbi:hypothetical protein CsSME_00027777 [Camellia sinensis var. sinensis]